MNAKFEVLLEKYGFVVSVIETGEALGNVFMNSTLAEPEPPVIYVDLSAAEGEYDFGDKVAVLDLSWYAKYKPSVDVFLSAFLWGFFIWRVYIRLPSIISGESMTVEDFGNAATLLHKVSGSSGKYEKTARYKGKFER